MVTISHESKYICVWGNPTGIDSDTITEYKSKGYKIVNVNNGTESIKDCMKSVVSSYRYI